MFLLQVNFMISNSQTDTVSLVIHSGVFMYSFML